MEPYDDAMSAACGALQRMIESSLDMPIRDQPIPRQGTSIASAIFQVGQMTSVKYSERPQIYFLGSLAGFRGLRSTWTIREHFWMTPFLFVKKWEKTGCHRGWTCVAFF